MSLSSSSIPPEKATPGGVEVSFPADYERACQLLRGALIQLYAASGAEAGRPQRVGKQIGINRNVAWKLTKLIQATDPYQMHAHFPGSQGMEIVLAAFERAGSPRAEVEAVRSTWRGFEAMVARHAGSRRRLGMLLSSRSAQAGFGDEGLIARRTAFEGMSGVFGAQARVRLAVSVLAPNPGRPDRLDGVSISGLLDFRRLRESARWPLVQLQAFSTEEEAAECLREPLDPRASKHGEAPLLLDFSSSPPPQLDSIDVDGMRIHELSVGAVGRSAAIDAVFGTISRAFGSIHGDQPDSVGEHYCRIDTPVERLLFELYIHRELPFELPPSLSLYSLLHGRVQFPLSQQQEFLLPVPGKLQDLGSPPVVSTPVARRHPQLVELACRAVGHELAEFRGFRYELAFPPLPATAILHHPLPPVSDPS